LFEVRQDRAQTRPKAAPSNELHLALSSIMLHRIGVPYTPWTASACLHPHTRCVCTNNHPRTCTNPQAGLKPYSVPNRYPFIVPWALKGTRQGREASAPHRKPFLASHLEADLLPSTSCSEPPVVHLQHRTCITSLLQADKGEGIGSIGCTGTGLMCYLVCHILVS